MQEKIYKPRPEGIKESERDNYTSKRMKEAEDTLSGIDELISQENLADSYKQHSAQ